MDFKSKNMQVNFGTVKSSVRLHIWDTAGDEKFRNLSKVYYKGANAMCLVYDCTSEKTFEALQWWAD